MIIPLNRLLLVWILNSALFYFARVSLFRDTCRYSCSGTNTFVAGPSVRTCMEDTQQFSGSTPQCLTCGVVNCLQCVNTTTTCVRCAVAHDLTADGSQCVERSQTVIVLGGQYVVHCPTPFLCPCLYTTARVWSYNGVWGFSLTLVCLLFVMVQSI